MTQVRKKICSNPKCLLQGVEQELSEFHKAGRGHKYGRSAWCKSCVNSRNRERYSKFVEKNRQRASKNRERNPNYIRDYFKTTKGLMSRRAANSRRHAKNKGLYTQKYTLEDLADKRTEYNNRCAYCGIDGINFEMDHVISKCEGGPDCIENLVPACQDCNRGKNGKFNKSLLTWKNGKYSNILVSVIESLRIRSIWYDPVLGIYCKLQKDNVRCLQSAV